MDPITLSALSSLAPAAGGLLGQLFGAGDREASEEAYKNALLQATTLKPLQLGELDLADYTALASPEVRAELAEQMGPSAMERIAVDPRLKAAQMKALEDMQAISASGGMTAEEIANLNKIRRDVASSETARQQAMLQNLQARGLGTSGAEIASRLVGSQAAANRESEQADRQAALAQARAMEAIAKAGTLGGSMRGQEFGEQSSIAQAQDIINRFNTGLRSDVQQRNIASQNALALKDWANRQEIANRNVGNRQTEQKTAYERPIAEYNADVQRRKMVADAQTNMGRHYAGEAAATAQTGYGIGAGIGQAGAAYGSSLSRDAQRQEDSAFKEKELAAKIAAGAFGV